MPPGRRKRGASAPSVPTSATPKRPASERKQIPATIHPENDRAFRGLESRFGWQEARRIILARQREQKISDADARQARLETRSKRAAGVRAGPRPVDFDAAYRRLFPWTPSDLALAPSQWAPGGEPGGDDAPKPTLAIDHFIYHMRRLKGGFGRLRPNVEGTGFACFYLAARAGIYRATVAAALELTVVEARRRDGGTISRLEAMKSEAERLGREIIRFLSTSDGRDVLPSVQRGGVSPNAADIEQRRHEAADALAQCVKGTEGLSTIAFLAAEEIARFPAPTKKGYVWGAAFAESLVGTWAELTGDLPDARSFDQHGQPKNFNLFVDWAYQTIADDDAKIDWEHTVRGAVRNVRARGRHGGAEERAGGSPDGVPNDPHDASFYAWRESVWTSFRHTRPSFGILDVRLRSILHFEATRRDPTFRPLVERLIKEHHLR